VVQVYQFVSRIPQDAWNKGASTDQLEPANPMQGTSKETGAK
jgi:hypothetical protein